MQATTLDRVGQRLHDVLLPGELGKALRAPFAGENLIGHRWWDERVASRTPGTCRE